MQRLKGLDELTPADLWREVPRDDDEFWPDVRERQQRLAKTLIEGALEEEMTLLLGAGRYRRVEVRHGYRNGFYERDLATQIGIVTAIRVPRARDQAARRPVFRRYQRRQAQVNDVIRDVFLAGVSTRRVGEALEALVGERVSAQTVSRVARSLDRRWPAFSRRRSPTMFSTCSWMASTCGSSRRPPHSANSCSALTRSLRAASAGCLTSA